MVKCQANIIKGLHCFDDDILFQDLLQELIHVFLLQNDFQVESAAFFFFT